MCENSLETLLQEVAPSLLSCFFILLTLNIRCSSPAASVWSVQAFFRRSSRCHMLLMKASPSPSPDSHKGVKTAMWQSHQCHGVPALPGVLCCLSRRPISDTHPFDVSFLIEPIVCLQEASTWTTRAPPLADGPCYTRYLDNELTWCSPCQALI